MPFHIRVHDTHRVQVLDLIGVLDLATCRDSSVASFEHPQFNASFAQLIDLSQVTQIDMRYKEVAQLVTAEAPDLALFSPDTRYVIIAPSDTAFGMARMYQQVANGAYPFAVHVVRSPAEALTCIGVDPAAKPEIFG